VQALLGDEPARAQLSARLHEIANRRYRWSVVADQYRSVFTRLLGQEGRA
jgi:glycosyltransferase involved in cell wall biosynthesis